MDVQRADQAHPALLKYPLGGRIVVVRHTAHGRDIRLAQQILHEGGDRLGGISAAAKSIRHRIHDLTIGARQFCLDSRAAQSRELAAQALHHGESQAQLAEGLAACHRRQTPLVLRKFVPPKPLVALRGRHVPIGQES